MRARARGWMLETRIRVGLVATAALLAPVVGLAVWGFSEVAARIRQASRVEAVQLRAEADASRALAQAQIARARFLRTGEPLYAGIANERLEQAIARCREALPASDRERPAFSRAGRLLRESRDRIRWEAQAAAPVQSARPGVPLPSAWPTGGPASLPGSVRVEDLFAEVETILGGIGDRAWSELDRTNLGVDRLSQSWLRNLITASLVTVLGVIAAAILLPARIAEPFRRLRGLVRRVEREGRVDPAVLSEFPDDPTREVAETLVSAVGRSRETIELQAARIRTLEHRYRVLLRQHPRPALVVSSDHRIVLAGGPVEAVFGVPPAALEKRDLGELFSADGLPAVLRRVASEGEGGVVALVNVHRPDGGASKVQATVTALRDEQRRVREFLVLLGPSAAKV